MKSSDETLLNRFLDNDLTPEEFAELQLQINASKELKTRLAEYGQVRDAIGGMPRARIPEDMAARLAPLLSEPPAVPLFTKLASSVLPRWLTGSAALLMLTGSYYLFTSQIKPRKLEQPVLSYEMRNNSNDTANIALITETAKAPGQDQNETKKIEIAEVKSTPNVTILTKTADASQPDEVEEKKLDPEIMNLVNRLGQIDRRHLVQIHVDVANDRVFNGILRTIEKYRSKDAQVALRRIEENDDNPPKYDFVAMVPTQLVDEMNTELEKSFNGNVELHSPLEESWNNEMAEELEPIARETIETAIAESDDPQARLRESQGNSTQKPTSIINKPNRTSADIRRDLYSQRNSVKELTAPGSGSSMDEVVVRIRSDSAKPEGNFGRARVNTRRMNRKMK